MKIEISVEEIKGLMEIKTPSAGTLDVDKKPIETMKEALNQALRQDLSIRIDTKAPSLIELTELLKKK